MEEILALGHLQRKFNATNPIHGVLLHVAQVSGTSAALLVANPASAAQQTITGGLKVTGAVDFDSTLNVDGNTTLGGTLGVTGATTFSAGLKIANAQNLMWRNGGNTADVTVLTMDANNNVTLQSGPNGASQGALTILSHNTLTLKNDAASGGVLIQKDGSLTVQNAAGTTTQMTLTGAGNLSILGDFAVNTNKFTVVAATGNTAVAGTLGVTGATTLAGMTATTGSFSSTLGVTGVATFSSNISQSGTGTFSTGTGNVSLNGNVTVASGKTFTLAGTGLATFGGNVTITGDLTVQGTTVTMNTSTVDVEDRIISVNKTTGTVAVPTLPTGLSVHRGNDGTADRQRAGIIWDETNSRWVLSLVAADDSALIASGEQDLRLKALVTTTTATVGTNLTVNGTTTLTGALTANGAADFNSTANFDGVTTHTANVSLTGAAALSLASGNLSLATGNISHNGGQWWSDGTNMAVRVPSGGAFSIQTIAAGNANANLNVADVISTGNGSFTGTLSAAGNFTINTNKFVVTAASGNVEAAGTLRLGTGGTTGNVKRPDDASNAFQFGNGTNISYGVLNIATTAGVTKISLDGATGNVDFDGTMQVDGNVTVGSSKVVITASTGATTFAGAVTLPGAPTAGLHAVTKDYADTLLSGGASTPTFASLTVTGTTTLNGNVNVGNGNQDYLYEMTVPVAVDTRSQTIAYNGDGTIQSITEKDGATTVKTTTFSYNADGTVDTATVVSGGKTITYTYSYDGNGNLTGRTKTVV